MMIPPDMMARMNKIMDQCEKMMGSRDMQKRMRRHESCQHRLAEFALFDSFAAARTVNKHRSERPSEPPNSGFTAHFARRMSRISSTGHSGAVVPVHWATVFASRRSSLRRSLIFSSR